MLLTDKSLRKIGDAAAQVAARTANAALADRDKRIAALETRLAALEAAGPKLTDNLSVSTLETRLARLEKIEAAARTAGAQ